MKKITFKSVESLAKWIVKKSKKLDSDARIMISETPGLERVNLVNELVKNGLPLKGLKDEGGVIFVSSDGLSLELEGNKRNKYDIIMIHSINKLHKTTIETCVEKCRKLVRFVFEDEEIAHQKELEVKKAKEAEMSKKEVLVLPDGFKVREDKHGLSYIKEDENGSVTYSYYNSEELDDECLKRIANSILEDLI